MENNNENQNNNENENENNNAAENNPNTTSDERFIERDGEKLSISENFWNKEKNEPDTFAILKAATDLRKQIGEDQSPKDGAYQISIPEEYKDKLQADPEDPLYKEFCKIAKAKKMSQKDFDAVAQIYYKTIAENAQDFDSDAYIESELKLAKEKFGNDLDKVKYRIENFVNNSGITDKDILNELAFLQTTAGGVATLDYLLSLRGEPMPRSDSNSPTGQLSENELRNLVASEAYQNGDKVVQEKVRKGYETLYKTY